MLFPKPISKLDLIAIKINRHQPALPDHTSPFLFQSTVQKVIPCSLQNRAPRSTRSSNLLTRPHIAVLAQVPHRLRIRPIPRKRINILTHMAHTVPTDQSQTQPHAYFSPHSGHTHRLLSLRASTRKPLHTQPSSSAEVNPSHFAKWHEPERPAEHEHSRDTPVGQLEIPLLNGLLPLVQMSAKRTISIGGNRVQVPEPEPIFLPEVGIHQTRPHIKAFREIRQARDQIEQGISDRYTEFQLTPNEDNTVDLYPKRGPNEMQPTTRYTSTPPAARTNAPASPSLIPSFSLPSYSPFQAYWNAPYPPHMLTLKNAPRGRWHAKRDGGGVLFFVLSTHEKPMTPQIRHPHCPTVFDISPAGRRGGQHQPLYLLFPAAYCLLPIAFFHTAPTPSRSPIGPSVAPAIFRSPAHDHGTLIASRVRSSRCPTSIKVPPMIRTMLYKNPLPRDADHKLVRVAHDDLPFQQLHLKIVRTVVFRP